MTVLEKIKKCVSLVWDFQEIYCEEDIEDFCHNELRTYPQHNEIMEYFKQIENLEKANEWHYVKDGDLPKAGVQVLSEQGTLVIYKGDGFNWVEYSPNADNIKLRKWEEPIAWCEIPKLPKEDK